ncbi:MAG: TlpA disulfide reductase family protein [Candidatus Wallbacteria bacterium]|nr:TlpA disulfide reductase family protein [Candidatus Wallbacteria bacterium]
MKLFLLFLFLSFILPTWGHNFPGKADQKILGSNEQAKNFTLPYYDTQSKKFNLKENYPASNLVFVFFASWCSHCQKDIPGIDSIKDKYPGTKFIAVNAMETADEIKAFFKKFNLSLPCLMDEKGDVIKLYGITGIPAFLVLNKSGEQLMLGNFSIVELESLLKNLRFQKPGKGDTSRPEEEGCHDGICPIPKF